jgi:hypothetical protein
MPWKTIGIDTITHIVPFAALMATNPPKNRPLLTRIIEQTLVGIIAGGIGVAVAMYVSVKVIESNLETINEKINRMQQLHTIDHQEDIRQLERLEDKTKEDIINIRREFKEEIRALVK